MRGHSKDQINKVKRDMYRMFKKAQKNNMIIFNPAEDLDTPKAKDGKRRAITDEERSLILSVAKTEPQGLWIKTMLYCGFRPGETVPTFKSAPFPHTRTLSKVIFSPTSAFSFSIVTRSPSVTLYCFPPVSIIAYI